MTVIILLCLLVVIYIIKKVFKFNMPILVEDKKKGYNRGSKIAIETRLYYKLFNIIPFLYFRRIIDYAKQKEMFTIRIMYIIKIKKTLMIKNC